MSVSVRSVSSWNQRQEAIATECQKYSTRGDSRATKARTHTTRPRFHQRNDKALRVHRIVFEVRVLNRDEVSGAWRADLKAAPLPRFWSCRTRTAGCCLLEIRATVSCLAGTVIDDDHSTSRVRPRFGVVRSRRRQPASSPRCNKE